MGLKHTNVKRITKAKHNYFVLSLNWATPPSFWVLFCTA